MVISCLRRYLPYDTIRYDTGVAENLGWFLVRYVEVSGMTLN